MVTMARVDECLTSGLRARVANSLQYFAENQIGQAKALSRRLSAQPICFRIARAHCVGASETKSSAPDTNLGQEAELLSQIRCSRLWLFETGADARGAIGRDYISADVEKLSRCCGRVSCPIVAQLDLLPHDRSSGKRAIGVKAEELKGGGVHAPRFEVPKPVAGPTQRRRGVCSGFPKRSAPRISEHGGKGAKNRSRGAIKSCNQGVPRAFQLSVFVPWFLCRHRHLSKHGQDQNCQSGHTDLHFVYLSCFLFSSAKSLFIAADGCHNHQHGL